MTYDRAHSRWLPVGYQFVSPDGNHYAYGSSSGIYVVDASNSSQVEIGEGHQWQILNVLNDRVFATVPGAPGFWVLPFSGAPVEVTTQSYWQAASTNAAYGTSTSAVPVGATQELIRLDVATGKTTHWFSIPNAAMAVVGFDSQTHPLLQVNYFGYGNSWELWVTTGPDQGYVLANSLEGMNIQGPFIPDAHGLWFTLVSQFGGNSGLALYIPGAAIFEMSTIGASLAGGCS